MVTSLFMSEIFLNRMQNNIQSTKIIEINFIAHVNLNKLHVNNYVAYLTYFVLHV